MDIGRIVFLYRNSGLRNNPEVSFISGADDNYIYVYYGHITRKFYKTTLLEESGDGIIVIPTDPQNGITMKEMCETIIKADFLRRDDGSAPTAEEIFSYSPTGELFTIFEWYWQAVGILGEAA